MKAISIGYSTEDNTLFLDKIEDLAQFKWRIEFRENSSMQWGGAEGLDKLLEELNKNYLESEPDPEDLARWEKNLAEFRAAVAGQEGLAYGWAVEYDDNVMVVFDTTHEQLQEASKTWQYPEE